jgi:zinc protease
MQKRWFVSLIFVAHAALANPAIETWETANGAKVLYVQAAELPMVDVRIAFDAGSARDGQQSGLATMTNGMLAEGAGGLSGHALSERFEAIGAQFRNGAERDMAWVSLRSLADPQNLKPASDNLALILARPDFPAAVFERERKRLLIALKQKQQDPSELADDAFYAAVYKGHPYASPPEGTEETVTAIRREDLKRFYERYYTARNAVIAIIGALTQAESKALAEKLIGQLPAGQKAGTIPLAPPLTKPVEIKIPYPSAQTHIRVGQPGMTRPDPDFFPLYVGNHALGGSGLVSHLAEEIREKRGLSYSVYSYFMPMRAAGPFMAGLETRNDQAREALNLLRGAIAQFVEEGPSQKEFESSVKSITGGFPLRIDSNGKIVEYLMLIGFYGLPLDYLDTFVKRTEAVKIDEVRAMFKRRLTPANFVTVVVGGTAKPGQAAEAPPPAVGGRRH